jgi:hypothetical protein
MVAVYFLRLFRDLLFVLLAELLLLVLLPKPSHQDQQEPLQRLELLQGLVVVTGAAPKAGVGAPPGAGDAPKRPPPTGAHRR